MRYAFAGDRDISVNVLSYLIQNGYKPSALLVTEKEKASHANELIELANIETQLIFHGKDFEDQKSQTVLKDLQLDYIIGIHFPYLISNAILLIPKIGFLNLHPAYLPFNKGWHTPSWAIIENTPYGATLHFMSEQLDNGDIIHQKICSVTPCDTANTLYQKVKEIELEVFKESLPWLASLNPPRSKQEAKGTSHLKKDIKKVQVLNPAEVSEIKDIINKLRGLTTNRLDEAAYFIENGKKYFVQVKITQDQVK